MNEPIAHYGPCAVYALDGDEGIAFFATREEATAAIPRLVYEPHQQLVHPGRFGRDPQGRWHLRIASMGRGSLDILWVGTAPCTYRAARSTQTGTPR